MSLPHAVAGGCCGAPVPCVTDAARLVRAVRDVGPDIGLRTANDESLGSIPAVPGKVKWKNRINLVEKCSFLINNFKNLINC
jgi:hypothetical protein